MQTLSLFAALLFLGFAPDDVEKLKQDFHAERIHMIATQTRADRPNEIALLAYLDWAYFMFPRELEMESYEGKIMGDAKFGLDLSDFDHDIETIKFKYTENGITWIVPHEALYKLLEKPLGLKSSEMMFYPAEDKKEVYIRGTETIKRGEKSYAYSESYTSFFLVPRNVDHLEERYQKMTKIVPESSILLQFGSKKKIESIIANLKPSMTPEERERYFKPADLDGEVAAGKKKPLIKTLSDREQLQEYDRAWENARPFYAQHYHSYKLEAFYTYKGPSSTIGRTTQPVGSQLVVSVHAANPDEAIIALPSSADPRNIRKGGKEIRKFEAAEVLKLYTTPATGNPKVAVTDSQMRRAGEDYPEYSGYDIDAESFLANIVAASIPKIKGKPDLGLVCLHNTAAEPVTGLKNSACVLEGGRWVIRVRDPKWSPGHHNSFVVTDYTHTHKWEISMRYGQGELPNKLGRYYPVVPLMSSE